MASGTEWPCTRLLCTRVPGTRPALPSPKSQRRPVAAECALAERERRAAKPTPVTVTTVPPCVGPLAGDKADGTGLAYLVREERRGVLDKVSCSVRNEEILGTRVRGCPAPGHPNAWLAKR